MSGEEQQPATLKEAIKQLLIDKTKEREQLEESRLQFDDNVRKLLLRAQRSVAEKTDEWKNFLSYLSPGVCLLDSTQNWLQRTDSEENDIPVPLLVAAKIALQRQWFDNQKKGCLEDYIDKICTTPFKPPVVLEYRKAHSISIIVFDTTDDCDARLAEVMDKLRPVTEILKIFKHPLADEEHPDEE